MPLSFRALIPALIVFAALCLTASFADTKGIDFNQDIRPILTDHCFKCHGPDGKPRQAGLRLDLRASATSRLPNGHRAIAPGKPDQSELVRRIFAQGASVMPPPSANKPLTDAQKHILKRWVAAGAAYVQHWAFVPPKLPPLPRVSNPFWPRNAIDFFVLNQLDKERLKPSSEADRFTLCRRLFLDLIGLPPTPEEADAFVRDTRPNAYEQLVDKLLASRHYGERWARRWLDIARYADTNGFEKDSRRSIWPYRDWLIDAFNADMPFDQFTIEQIAGDMLAEEMRKRGNEEAKSGSPIYPFLHFASSQRPQDMRIATGFNRNTMLNEEGGIDPLEYRFYSMVDRVNVVGTTWLGLTVGCAQCHSHKFDPITQTEYYRMMAYLDNAEEPQIEVVKPEITALRRPIEEQIATREAGLADQFPPGNTMVWESSSPTTASTTSAAKAEILPDGSVRISGDNPASDTYSVVLDSDAPEVDYVRIEALTDPSLGGGGPGRTPHGNFVLTEVNVYVEPKGDPGKSRPIKLSSAVADFAQDGFPAAHAIDLNSKTGWAVHGPEPWNINHTLTIQFAEPVRIPGGSRWTIRLEQQYGGNHTLGRFRISLGKRSEDPRPIEIRREENLQRRFGEWLLQQEARAVHWTILRPEKAVSNLPLLTVQSDNSIFVSGDETKRDVYDLDFDAGRAGVTALRLETLPDDRLPKRGPGRVFYEGSHGDFFLSEVTVTSAGHPAKLTRATATFGSNIQHSIDGDPQTGWSIAPGQGQAHTAVFNLEKPLGSGRFSLRLLFERYHAADLGRFRVSVTSDPRMAEAGLPSDVEAIALIPSVARTPAQSERLMRQFLSTALDLAAERDAIKKLRDQLPQYPTTLVFRERAPGNPRITHLHHRGEFLQPEEAVRPGIPAILPQMSLAAKPDRLAFAEWLVDPNNPLSARVTVNRQWQAFFGRGIVPTLEDFGTRGQRPSHPELLDWLAIQFQSREGCRWSLKKLHKLIVMSATYRQSSRVTPLLVARDPQNMLLARGPKLRLEAELLRDSALTASGLLSRKIGGPSVFPPQQPGITTMGVYGPLEWKVSEGEDRFRRGLYTFSKRTAPYAMFTTFDAPSGESSCPRREMSNTPLQALATMNDAVFVEAAQALGKMIASQSGSVQDRAVSLFRRCLTRPPDAAELRMMVQFYQNQKMRLESKELDAAVIAGSAGTDAVERAAWTVLARTLLNLDEAVTKS